MRRQRRWLACVAISHKRLARASFQEAGKLAAPDREPNLSLYFNPQFRHGRPVSPTLYRRLINAFYAAVKSVSRSNLVLMAGLGPIAVPGLTIGPMRFTRELLCMRGRRNPHPLRGNCHVV